MKHLKYFVYALLIFPLSAGQKVLTLKDIEEKCSHKSGLLATLASIIGLSSSKDPYAQRERPSLDGW